jgi:hypothetical protein
MNMRKKEWHHRGLRGTQREWHRPEARDQRPEDEEEGLNSDGGTS